MKLKKADIYNQYGIQYKKEGNAEKIFCEPLKKWISPVLTWNTNKKVGKAYTFSILHGNEDFEISAAHEKVAAVMKAAGVTSVKGSCPCHCKGCYCDNGCYNFPDNKARAMEKLILARFFTAWLKRAIIAQIMAEHRKDAQLRIHAQGDFFSAEYAEMWRDVVKAVKGVCDIFWTYTKDENALEILRNVDGLSIVPSITPCGLNFGTCAELLARREQLIKDGHRVHICACGTQYEKHCAECTTGCKAIGTTCDYVLFIKHSVSDYTAGESDPAEFKTVCDIIAAQDN